MNIVLAITGATGVVYGITILRELARANITTHLVLSNWAQRTIESETSYTVSDINDLASCSYAADNLLAPIACGTFRHEGMVIAPCSMKTLSAIANGYADNLVSRAAEVTLTAKRRLILLPGETPLHEIHLDNMLKLARAGAVILPPVPAFYYRPATITDIVHNTVGRALDLLDIENDLVSRWEGL